jgi:NAD(P)-dependent dehydrogenase (short-subunit alcohol dehydrogenase family)
MIHAENDIPDLSGRIALVTGSTSGLGLEASRMLAGAGARVLMTGRSAEKGETALSKIAGTQPRGTISFHRMDLASLDDVVAGATAIAGELDHLDILINNAGIMAPPKRLTTRDGFEAQFGTNHLAHFALTGHLLPLLRRSAAPRVISVASLAALFGKINFDDLQAERGYSDMGVYSQSKLANLLFINEFARRSADHGWDVTALVAHPGLSRTSLFKKTPEEMGFADRLGRLFSPFFSQSAADGALPLVAAATDADARPGDYYGPGHFWGLKGPPKKAGQPKAAGHLETARRLWEVSEQLTGLRYPDR